MNGENQIVEDHEPNDKNHDLPKSSCGMSNRSE